MKKKFVKKYDSGSTRKGIEIGAEKKTSIGNLLGTLSIGKTDINSDYENVPSSKDKAINISLDREEGRYAINASKNSQGNQKNKNISFSFIKKFETGGEMVCQHRPDGVRGQGKAIRGSKFTGVK